MTITRKHIEQIRSHARMRIDAALEDMVLVQHGEEPDGPEYTEQDLHEQIRKLINQYNLEHPDPRLVNNPPPWTRSSSTAPAPTKHRRCKYIQ